MSITLYWMQAGGCGGDSMALLNLASPDLVSTLELLDIEVLWHPSLSNMSPEKHDQLVQNIISGEQKLDIFCVEGAIIRGPNGTGMYSTSGNQPKKDLVAKFSKMAEHVIAVGTCAAFGGIGADGEIEATGLQFHKKQIGGFLGESFSGKKGMPVINLPGCPCHCEVVAGVFTALAMGSDILLNEYNAPMQWYGLLVHQGCIRNEYHEFRVEEHNFGEKGCLFFHLGCRGPLTHGPCNKLLWNGRSSKTAVGVPCFGCTSPEFPQENPFFETQNIVGIPIDLPEGVDRAHYLAYKGMAAAAAPDRLKERKTGI